MHEMRLEQCRDVHNRLEETVTDHGKRLGDVERKVDVNINETSNVCKKLDNLTKALWGLTSSFILAVIGLIITIIFRGI
jgi:tetrahydromethanopterin S-methyltransferase subunit G